jgi:hypothetical protein
VRASRATSSSGLSCAEQNLEAVRKIATTDVAQTALLIFIEVPVNSQWHFEALRRPFHQIMYSRNDNVKSRNCKLRKTITGVTPR